MLPSSKRSLANALKCSAQASSRSTPMPAFSSKSSISGPTHAERSHPSSPKIIACSPKTAAVSPPLTFSATSRASSAPMPNPGWVSARATEIFPLASRSSCLRVQIFFQPPWRIVMGRIARISVIAGLAALILFALHLANPASHAQNASFHNAPPSAKTTKNPYEGQQPDAARSVYQSRCAACHGPNGEGSGNIPSLTSAKAQGASDGELFWYITKGDVNNGMPAWESLPEKDRWQIVNFLRVLGGSKPGSPRVRLSADEAVATAASAPPPKPPFTDYRYEKPGVVRTITLEDLPAPFATACAGNGPQLVSRPESAWPQVPAGFKVELY